MKVAGVANECPNETVQLRFNAGFGPFRLDRDSRRLMRGVESVPLRAKTFAVLEHLVARPGRLVTKDDLLSAIWPGTAIR